MKTDYIQPVVDSTCNLFSQMLHLEVEPISTFQQESANNFYEITGMIDFTKGVKGSLITSFEKKTAREIVGRLLHREFREVNSLVVDGIGEITNLICGNSKSGLAKFGWQLQLSIPHVVLGEKYSIQRPKGVVSVSTVFECKAGKFMVDLSIKPETNIEDRG